MGKKRQLGLSLEEAARMQFEIEGEGDGRELVLSVDIKRKGKWVRIAKRYSGQNWVNLEPGYTVRGSEPGGARNLIEIEYEPANTRPGETEMEQSTMTLDDYLRSIPQEMKDKLGLSDGTWEIVEVSDGKFQYRMTDLGIAKLRKKQGTLTEANRGLADASIGWTSGKITPHAL